MTKYTLQVGGMACSMCEAHVNNAVRKAFPVKKVSSSHTKKQMVILSEQPLDEEALRRAITETGYEVKAVESKPYEKHGLFHR